MAKHRPFAAISTALLAACTGVVNPEDGSTQAAPGVLDGAPGAFGGAAPSGTPGAVVDLPVPGAAGLDGAGPMPLARLTRTEYVNTVNELSGGAAELTVDKLPADGLGDSGFTSDIAVSQVELDQLFRAATSVAPAVLAHLLAKFPCDAALSGEAACAQQYIEQAGARIYRRPLAADEVGTLAAHADAVRAAIASEHLETLRVLTLTMLMSPSFLYRWEVGYQPAEVEGRLVRFNDFEVASRLSYFLWRSMPDDALFAAATAGQLGTPEEVAVQARRMLQSDSARAATFGFFEQWMHIENVAGIRKDTGLYPQFSAQLAEDFRTETRRFLEHVIFEGEGTLTALLNSKFSFANARLAGFYGVSGVTGDEFVRIELPAERAGLFTQGSFLAATGLPSGTSPPRRAKAIMDRVACIPVPPPPDGLEVTIPPPSEGKQTREIFAEHAVDPQCVGCHSIMDPIGFAFEHFDGSGAYRAEEAGRPVDTTGSLPQYGAFDGAAELLGLMAGTPEVGACSTRSWLRYLLGRIETKEEKTSFDAIASQFEQSGYQMQELLVAITTSPTFRFRTRMEGETL